VDDVRKLCTGPGKLVHAMGITLQENGCSLLSPPLYIEEIWLSAQYTLSCLDKSQLILTDNGFIRLEQLINNNTKLGFNELDINIHDGTQLIKSNSFYMSEKSDLFEVKFKSGASLITTKNHPLMTKSGWKCVEDIIENKDAVLCKYNQNIFGKNIDFNLFNPNLRRDAKKYNLSNIDISYLCGLWIAEGHFTKKSVGITNTDNEITNWLKSIGFKNYDDRHYYINSVWVLELLKWMGCAGTSHTKRIPYKILSASKEEQVAFLQGLFDGDGCSLGSKGIKLTSVSYELLSNTRTMLLNMGINSYIREVTWEATKSTVIKDKSRIFYGFELYISGFDAHSFYSQIGFRLTRKQKGWKKLSEKSIKRIYPDKNIIKNLISEHGMSINEFSKKHKCYYNRYLWYNGKGLSITSVKTLLDLSKNLKESENYKLLEQQYIKDTSEYYDTVVSVKYSKHDFSYDIKVPQSEKFICDGYLNHNTGGKSIILSTPCGVGNFFHKTWVEAEAKKNKFKTIRLPWHLHPDRDQKWRDQQTELSGVKGAAQECDCEFSTTGNTVVDIPTIEFYKNNSVVDPVEIRGSDKGLWLWEYPDYSKNYIVSADVSRGDSSDFSAFHIIDVENLSQIGEYQGLISTKDYGNMLVNIASEYNNALLIVENANIGWAVLQQIIDRGYPNTFYSSTDLQYVDVERQMSGKYNHIDKKMVPGFTTTMKTRPVLVSRLEMYFRERSVNVRSIRLMNELSTFIWNGNKPEAMVNHNDDLVMSFGIGLWVRDTALKLRQQGMDLTKSMLNNIKQINAPDPIYKSGRVLTAQQAWEMNVGGKYGSDKKESLKWLL
jgi:intein/homing endonuclease